MMFQFVTALFFERVLGVSGLIYDRIDSLLRFLVPVTRGP